MLLLARGEIAALLPIGDVIDAVESALLSQARSGTSGPLSARLAPPPARAPVAGGFHAKGAGLERGDASYVAVKVNGNFPDNPRLRELPTIQGLIVLADGSCGTPLAVLDSIEITALRTAAASAVATRRLARAGARRATIAGCGVQGFPHASALRHVLPELELLFHDLDSSRMAALAERARTELGGQATTAPSLEEAVRSSDVVVTCTTAREPIVRDAWVGAGTFVAGVGADAPGKQELDAELLARARVVVDDLEACATGGDLSAAIAAGAMTREEVAARLAEVVAGTVTVRRDESDVVVFDSTGTALQDVAAASLAYERAMERGVGTTMDFARS